MHVALLQPEGRTVMDGATPNRDLAAAARDAAIQALAASDTAPIASADELVASITGASLKMIVAARIRLFLEGHTPEADEYLPIALLVHEAQQHAAQSGVIARQNVAADERFAAHDAVGADRQVGEADPQGRRGEGLLPVPQRKDAQLHVNDDKGFYHCFGCGAHGDAIRWLVDAQGLAFMDAVKELAASAGMDVPAPSPQAPARR
jgi:hypothetical protein